ncbi:septum formation inhibitor Maf [Marinobacter fuscus]|uniref:7-methyl-GTP pyrophosphatase n=1 Tax=Marinobacter fuscus TaxID=2109942 RepID=A0A2T1K790_9GAMM|nr:Maf family protein [Marinobacter fuscus]PSF05392.1 septum formation inhibitor Maf [Marinobacter fuscus]
MPNPNIVLASSSPYRKQLLARLGLTFTTASPDIDESPSPGENPEHLAVRLAREKARALQHDYPDSLIIGSDQVATLPDGTLLNKPGSHQAARAQLMHSSGQRIRFLTGLAVLDTRTDTITSHCEPFDVHFRVLSEPEIEGYLHKETPYDCAGSFKMEGLGITLFSSMEGHDPNSLIGLPLIALTSILIQAGVNPLTHG